MLSEKSFMKALITDISQCRCIVLTVVIGKHRVSMRQESEDGKYLFRR